MRAILAVALCLAAPELGAQSAAPSSLATFVSQARAATERYQDPAVAAEEGYRQVGPDFPGMGQHWIHPERLFRGGLDPARPPILEYARLGGRLALVGVAFAVLVRDGRPPDALPAAPADWHFHGGTISDESFLRSHANGAGDGGGGGGGSGMGHDEAGPELAVLHAWIWLDNPAGLFAPDNWALPYARHGFAIPAASPPAAARALALAGDSGGEAYLAALIAAVGRPDPAEASALAAVAARHCALIRAWLAGRAGSRELAPGELARLARFWWEMWMELEASASAEVRERLAAARGSLDSHGPVD